MDCEVDWLGFLHKLGPFIGGVSLLVASVVAWATFFLIHKRRADIAWIDGFHALYAEFWNDDEMAKVRIWIVSDVEYKAIAKILAARLFTTTNTLDLEANEKLETLDRFCALLTRIQYFSKSGISKKHRELWQALYIGHWIKGINDRIELKKYIEKYWDPIDLS